MTPLYSIRDSVIKDSGDYRFAGKVVAVFQKLSGAWRYVVENDAGILMILNETQIQRNIPNGETRA